MAQEVVSKSEHKPNADDNDCTTAITCSVCGEITTNAKAEHSYGEWTITKAPTENAVGEKVRTCSCGHVEKATIPAQSVTTESEDLSTSEKGCSGSVGGFLGGTIMLLGAAVVLFKKVR